MSAIQRMIDEMKRRGYATKTVNEYSGRLSTTMRYTQLTHGKGQPPVHPLDLLPPPESSADDTLPPTDD